MEHSRRPLIFPIREIVIKHNRRIIEETTGFYSPPNNLQNPNSLEWVLEVIQYPLFGIIPYPTIIEKAAIIAWTIIDGHVFFDGNKRTGMHIAESFLQINGYRLRADTLEIVNVAVTIANHKESNFELKDLVSWFLERVS